MARVKRAFAGVWAGFVGLGLAACPAEATPGESLHSRLIAADQLPINADPVSDLARAKALHDEARVTPGTTAEDWAIADLLYGDALESSDRWDEAMAVFADGLSRLPNDGSADYWRAQLLIGRANTEFDLHKLEAALATAQQAEALLRHRFGDGAYELMRVEGALAAITYRIGDQDEPGDYLARVLAHGEPRPRESIEYVTFVVGMAQSQDRTGHPREALDSYFQALAAARKYLPENSRFWGLVLSQLAMQLSDLGQNEQAEEMVRSAVAHNLKLYGRLNFDTAATMNEMTYVLARRDKYAEIEKVSSEVVEILNDPSVPTRQISVKAGAYVNLGKARFNLGKFAEAKPALDTGFALTNGGAKVPFIAVRAKQYLAQSALLQGKLSEALDEADVAVALARRFAPDEKAPARIDIEMLRAVILARMGRNDEAWSAAAPFGHVIEAKLSDPNLPQADLAELIAYYQPNLARFADIAWSTGHEDEAFRAAQFASLSQIALSGRAMAARLAAADPATAERVRDVQQAQSALEQLQRERVKAAGPAANALDGRIVDAQHRYDAARAALHRALPAYDELAAPTPQSLQAAIAGMNPSTAILMPVQSDDRLLTLTLTRAGLAGASGRLDRASATAAINALRGGPDGGAVSFDPAAAWKLGGALFNPKAMAALKSVREVAVVGSGPLMTLPFGMLLTAPPVKGRLAAQPYAIKRFAFSVRPLLGAEGSSVADKGLAFLGVGAPALGPADEALRGGRSMSFRGATLWRGSTADTAALRALPSLPATAHELATIARTIPNPANHLLTGIGATEAALRGEPLARFGVIAFATHGLVSGELRGLNEPALVLTPPVGPATTSDNDGLLTASEAAGLRLNARWVILSACNTGAGSDNGAGGYSGLARGFIQAGADSLLVSLWPLRDDAAARLTVDTVRFHARGESQAQALRHAELRLMGDATVPDSGNPAVWAPFSLVRQ